MPEVFGYHIDSQLTLEDLCKKASAKLNALSRISYYIDPLKRRLLVIIFFTSQFNYCSLSCMFHSRKLSNKINSLHERFQKNLQKLATEMLKTYMGMAPQIMNKVVPRNYALNYNLCRHPELASSTINTFHYGSESLSFLGPKIWEMLPLDLKTSDFLDSFKSRIKNWRPQGCPCRFCKSYIYQVGFTRISK